MDTANNYSYFYGGKGGESESIIGKWMKARGNRVELVIATKAGFNTPGIGNSLRGDVIQSEFEGSLKRLGTEYVDLYYAHKDQREDLLVETLESFHRLHRKGAGRSAWLQQLPAWRIEEARHLSRNHGWSEYCCVQAKYTYLRPRPGTFTISHPIVNDDLLDYCRTNRDVLLLAYSPTLGGAYQRDDRDISSVYQGADIIERLTALKKVAGQRGVTPVQVVLAWMLASDPIAIPLVPAGTIEQLDENLKSLDVVLSAEQLDELNTAGNR